MARSLADLDALLELRAESADAELTSSLYDISLGSGDLPILTPELLRTPDQPTSDSSSPTREPTTKAQATASRARKARPRARDKRKDELQYLRQRARELELQLQTLRSPMTGAKEATVAGSAVKQLFELSWRNIAKRQLGKRQRSETENQQLKRSLSEYVVAAQRLRLLIREKMGVKNHPQVDSALYSAPKTLEWTTADTETAEQFLKDVAVEYARVDAVFQQHNGEQLTCPNADEEVGFASVTSIPFATGDDVLYIDLRTTSMIPFSFPRVCDSAWSAVQKIFCFQHSLEQLPDQDPNVITAKLPSNAILDSSHQPPLESNCVLLMRRFIEKERMVFVWRTLCDDMAQSSTMVTDETGWAVFEPAPAQSGADSVVEGTLVRGCVHVIPIVRDTRLPQDPDEVRELTEKVVKCLSSDLSGLKSIIEDSLLQESLQFDRMAST